MLLSEEIKNCPLTINYTVKCSYRYKLMITVKSVSFLKLYHNLISNKKWYHGYINKSLLVPILFTSIRFYCTFCDVNFTYYLHLINLMLMMVLTKNTWREISYLSVSRVPQSMMERDRRVDSHTCRSLSSPISRLPLITKKRSSYFRLLKSTYLSQNLRI